VRINPVPFVLAPGIIGIGFALAGAAGAATAAGGWAAVVAVATAIAAISHRRSRIDR